MKFLITAASVAAAAFVTPALAQAQTATAPVGLYGTLGYADTHASGVDLGSIQARLGYRANAWLGVEGELAGGVKSDDLNVAPGVNAKLKLRHQEAIYGVGFFPVTSQIDLIGRVGYGHSKIRASALGNSASDAGDSWNFGAGAQYNFDGVNGVRADYTREEFTNSDAHANVWSIAYARKFY
jgi:outer membrane immunogenic protein